MYEWIHTICVLLPPDFPNPLPVDGRLGCVSAFWLLGIKHCYKHSSISFCVYIYVLIILIDISRSRLFNHMVNIYLTFFDILYMGHTYLTVIYICMCDMYVIYI